ncbi:MAG: O-antigen ligase family protein [Planctomycetota bacterium]|nr:O-antigen ligase family protein [Planctomycetota bacterium]
MHGPRPGGGAVRPWFGYALLGVGGALTSPNVPFALWWAAAYLGCVVVSWTFVDAPTPLERLQRARHLNYWTWAMACGLFLVLLYITRGNLFATTGSGLSGYGVSNRVRSFGGVTMVRASGLARSAAIPALFAFVLAWKRRGPERVLWGAVAVGCAAVVVLMQSRGATLSLAAGIAFAMLFMGRASRYLGIAMFLGILAVTIFGSELGVETEGARAFLNREEYSQRREITSGRTRDWGIAFDKIQESPLWGFGPQADRFFFGFHVHNTYLYAWLTAGLGGLLLFVLGLARAWRCLWRGARAGTVRLLGQEVAFIQAGSLLAFFTLRGIPEVSGSMFGIDTMLMLPAIAWLSALEEVRLEREGAGSPPEASS